jgi:hypothetical protein
MPIPKDEAVYAFAEPQHGHFTTAQGNSVGLGRNMLSEMFVRAAIERVSRGVYRVTHFPISPFSQYVEAMLWPEGGVQAVIARPRLRFSGADDRRLDQGSHGRPDAAVEALHVPAHWEAARHDTGEHNPSRHHGALQRLAVGHSEHRREPGRRDPGGPRDVASRGKPSSPCGTRTGGPRRSRHTRHGVRISLPWRTSWADHPGPGRRQAGTAPIHPRDRQRTGPRRPGGRLRHSGRRSGSGRGGGRVACPRHRGAGVSPMAIGARDRRSR